jgi:hypothetical protein
LAAQRMNSLINNFYLVVEESLNQIIDNAIRN